MAAAAVLAGDEQLGLRRARRRAVPRPPALALAAAGLGVPGDVVHAERLPDLGRPPPVAGGRAPPPPPEPDRLAGGDLGDLRHLQLRLFHAGQPDPGRRLDGGVLRPDAGLHRAGAARRSPDRGDLAAADPVDRLRERRRRPQRADQPGPAVRGRGGLGVTQLGLFGLERRPFGFIGTSGVAEEAGVNFTNSGCVCMYARNCSPDFVK